MLEVISESFAFSRGRALPLGATRDHEGINFSVFSQHATGVTLVLYRPGAAEPVAEFPLDPRENRTGNVWHARVTGIDPGIEYGYRVSRDKDWDEPAHRFDTSRVLLDPYARGCVRITLPHPQRPVRRSVIVDTSFDWQHDRSIDRPLVDSIIYELHVRAFTRDPSAGVKSPGTFAGLAEKIPYLQKLGITAVELMPVVEFDEQDNPRRDPLTLQPLVNFWGYHPLAYFAPHLPYGSTSSPEATLYDLKKMVRAFHHAGIEVLLDVVFNHSGEGSARDQISSLRGIDNSVYYLVDPATGVDRDYSGCGNTLNCNHPVVRDFVLDCLRYWVTEVHIDGFRFDLASILGRGRDGEVLANPPLIERIAADPILARTKLIAEAWDATGLYQVGSFPYGSRWAEWNGKFRDDVRRFVRGEPGMVPTLATRLAGSADLYQASGRAPWHGINFVTCHDGFTLTDLVSFGNKHNQANGEENRDGAANDLSWNCGCEGPTAAQQIVAVRKRQARNLATLLLLSQGVPMLLYGDEIGRTQRGNNNLYCHDNPISWVDWSLASENKSLLRFFAYLIAFRKAHRVLRRDSFVPRKGDREFSMNWHGTSLFHPNWNSDSHWLALHLSEAYAGKEIDHIYLMTSAYWEPLSFELPRVAGWYWCRVIDTSLSAPLDIADPGREQELISQDAYFLQPRSTVVLLGKREAQ